MTKVCMMRNYAIKNNLVRTELLWVKSVVLFTDLIGPAARFLP